MRKHAKACNGRRAKRVRSLLNFIITNEFDGFLDDLASEFRMDKNMVNVIQAKLGPSSIYG